jgi:hypothetical protein
MSSSTAPPSSTRSSPLTSASAFSASGPAPLFTATTTETVALQLTTRESEHFLHDNASQWAPCGHKQSATSFASRNSLLTTTIADAPISSFTSFPALTFPELNVAILQLRHPSSEAIASEALLLADLNRGSANGCQDASGNSGPNFPLSQTIASRASLRRFGHELVVAINGIIYGYASAPTISRIDYCISRFAQSKCQRRKLHLAVSSIKHAITSRDMHYLLAVRKYICRNVATQTEQHFGEPCNAIDDFDPTAFDQIEHDAEDDLTDDDDVQDEPDLNADFRPDDDDADTL